ncbi:MAG TPA: TonB family protein [Caulobacteraceae bacterium]
MRVLLAAAIAVFSLAGGTALAPAPSAAQPAPQAQSAGLCVLLGEKGEVIEARLAQTSGDPDLDQNAIAQARKLQWSPPYPQPGWLGVRITLSDTGPGDAPAGVPPHCSAASQAVPADAI